MNSRTPAAVIGLLGLVLLPLTGCGSNDPFEPYCDVVKAQQGPLTQAAGQGGGAGLIAALPSFRALQAKAPSDIVDDWTALVTAVEGLQNALAAADVDPATYSAKKPPAGLTTAQRSAISNAAAGLAAPRVVTASNRVQQEARDVCQTPLTLG